MARHKKVDPLPPIALFRRRRGNFSTIGEDERWNLRDPTTYVEFRTGAGVAVGFQSFSRLPHAPASVADARASLSPLEGVVDPRTFKRLRLLVTELVANSVRHATGNALDEGIALFVRASPAGIRVEVTDSGPGFTPLPPRRAPVEARGGIDQESGWGLQIVDALSDRGGADRDGRMRVWFELVPSVEFPGESRANDDRGPLDARVLTQMVAGE